MSAPFLVTSKKNAPKKIVIKPFKGVRRRGKKTVEEKVLNVFFSTPYPPYQSFPTTYWAKLCFVLLNAKPSNLPAVVPTIRSFFFLAFCKMQPTDWTDQRADASTQKARNTPILFFFKVPIQKKTFFHVPNVGCLGDLRQGWVEGETDVFFYGPTPSIFMPMVFSIIPPNGERKINGKKERKKTRNIFPSSKAFDWKHIFLAFFFALQATICWSVTSVSLRFSSKHKHSCCRMIFKKKSVRNTNYLSKEHSPFHFDLLSVGTGQFRWLLLRPARCALYVAVTPA